MNLSFEIARRYLFGKKSTNAINVITGVSVVGIAIGTTAIILILSVFNGFQSLIRSYLDDFNPDLKVTALEGKTFAISDSTYQLLQELPGVSAVSKTIEEVAIFEYRNSQEVGIIKGVDAQYNQVTRIDSTIREGEFVMSKNNVDFGIVAQGMAAKLGLNLLDAFTPITIYMPSQKKTVISKDFRTKDIYPGGTFSIQSENEYQTVICDYRVAQKLLGLKDDFSALEIKMDDPEDQNLKEEVQRLLGVDYRVQNRAEQDDVHLKIMNIEKWMSFLIGSLMMLIVAFNMIGCLWMIFLDKRKDISVMKSFGTPTPTIRNIFLTEGMLITFIGLISGFILALIIYYAQVHYGIIAMADGFIVEAYPIQIQWSDFLFTFIAVTIIGLLSSLMPALKAAQVPAYIREE